MAFSEAQVKNLEAKLDSKHVRTRRVEDTTLAYVEGWHVIAEANRIFGYDAWDRHTLSTHCVWSDHATIGTAQPIRPKCALPSGLAPLSSRGKAVGAGALKPLHPERPMSSHSKLPKLTRPSARSLPSAIPSGSHSMTA